MSGGYVFVVSCITDAKLIKAIYPKQGRMQSLVKQTNRFVSLIIVGDLKLG